MPFSFKPLLEAQGLGIVVRAFETLVDGFISHAQSSLDEFWDAFPLHPIRMINAVIGFFSGLLGIVLGTPFDVYESFFQDWLKEQKLGNKLMRVDDAIRIPFDALREFLRLVTFSGKSSLWGFVAGTIARFIYQTVKSIKLFRDLIKSKTMDEFVDVVLKSYERKFRLLRFIATILGIISLGLFVSLFFLFYGLIFSSTKWTTYILPQDSFRRFVIRKSFQKRFNVKPGFDT